MADERPVDPPSPFVARWIVAASDQVPARRRALDVAMGRGRHSELIAASGFTTFGVDLNQTAVREAVARAASHGAAVRGWCADLTTCPLPPCRFELIVVARYLQRDLCASIEAALVPGGLLIYETFTTAQLAYRRGPRSPDHLLQPGELGRQFGGLDTVFSEEVEAPDAVARLVARKPASQK